MPCGCQVERAGQSCNLLIDTKASLGQEGHPLGSLCRGKHSRLSERARGIRLTPKLFIGGLAQSPDAGHRLLESLACSDDGMSQAANAHRERDDTAENCTAS